MYHTETVRSRTPRTDGRRSRACQPLEVRATVAASSSIASHEATGIPNLMCWIPDVRRIQPHLAPEPRNDPIDPRRSPPRGERSATGPHPGDMQLDEIQRNDGVPTDRLEAENGFGDHRSVYDPESQSEVAT